MVHALMRSGPGLRVSLSFACEALLRVMPLAVDGPVDLQVSGERIGDLVELVVWSGAADVDAWAGASLTPQFSLQVIEGRDAGS